MLAKQIQPSEKDINELPQTIMNQSQSQQQVQIQEQCQFYNNKRKTFCSWKIIQKGQKYCNFHIVDGDFILCPLDNRHTIKQSNLKKHLKTCNVVKNKSTTQNQQWFVHQINNVIQQKTSNVDIICSKKKEKEQSQLQSDRKKYLQILQIEGSDELKSLLQKIPSAFEQAKNMYLEHIAKYNQSKEEIDVIFASDQALEELMSTATPQQSQQSLSHKGKDSAQLTLLLTKMKQMELLDQTALYVEFGAGKGHFSHEVSLALQQKSKHLLLEIGSNKFKFDGQHKSDAFYQRCKTDIADFDLNAAAKLISSSKLSQINAKSKIDNDLIDVKELSQIQHSLIDQREIAKIDNDLKVSKQMEQQDDSIALLIGISKHICGSAADLSINALLNCESNNQIHKKCLFLVTCCHHRIVTQLYQNMDFLLKLGFTVEETALLAKLSSWALSKIGQVQVKLPELVINDKSTQQETNPQLTDILSHCQLSSFEKTRIGFQIKRIFDIGRVMLLKQHKYDSFLMSYCKPQLTPENVVLYAVKNYQS